MMTRREMNLLLARVGLLDARMKRTDKSELAAMVEEWHLLLGDVSFSVAMGAAREHYASETRVLMPADVSRRVGPRRESADDVARAEWLAARGLTEEDIAQMPTLNLQALIRDGEVRGVGSV